MISNPDQADADGDGIGDVCDSCTDADGDGYCADADCDDTDSTIHPDATETCDGVDNDCDGTIDGITRVTECGVGACAGNTGEQTCEDGAWGSDTCDPLAGAEAEICDGVDNDCDGVADEDGVCDPAPDSDGDGVSDASDNCPDVANPNQADVDSGGTGDVCDDDTIYGYVTGEGREDISIRICRLAFFRANRYPDATVTDSEGYYAFGGLKDGLYLIMPKWTFGMRFRPLFSWVRIPGNDTRSRNFSIR